VVSLPKKPRQNGADWALRSIDLPSHLSHHAIPHLPSYDDWIVDEVVDVRRVRLDLPCLQSEAHGSCHGAIDAKPRLTLVKLPIAAGIANDNCIRETESENGIAVVLEAPMHHGCLQRIYCRRHIPVALPPRHKAQRAIERLILAVNV